MQDSELKVFVEGVSNYFKKLSNAPLNVGVPYVKDSNGFIGEITGVIGLTGRRKGGIFLTCGFPMVDEVIRDYSGAEDQSMEARKDMIGEMANTISGNASDAFGNDFQISVPVVITGKPDGVDMPTRVPTFVIPVQWKTHKAYLVIGVE
ncbi:MAG: chemotaxis protein CheX [Spirochaetes bacterium]|nr:chemotaxis protein CheX [Spirochaetota bacterium]